MIVEETNRRLNEQKDDIIKELTNTIEYLHSKLLQYEEASDDKSVTYEGLTEQNSGNKNNIEKEDIINSEEYILLKKSFDYMTTQFEYSQARCDKLTTRNESLSKIISDAKNNSCMNLSKQLSEARKNANTYKNQLKSMQSRYDRIRTYLNEHDMGDVLNSALNSGESEENSSDTVSEDKEEHLGSNLGDILESLKLKLTLNGDSSEDDEINKNKNKNEQELSCKNKEQESSCKNKEKDSKKHNKEKEEQQDKVEHITTVNGYTYDWEARVFWLESQVDNTHLESVPDIEKASNVTPNNDIYLYHVEVAEGEEERFNRNKSKFTSVFNNDIINNGAILKKGLINTSKLLMMGDSEAQGEIKSIINAIGSKGIPTIVNLAIFYDSVVREFTVEELNNHYGLDKLYIKETVEGLTNLFKARQLTSAHKKYLGVEQVCLIDSSLDKGNITSIKPTFARLYKLYIDGYGIDELIRLFGIEKNRENFVEMLIDKDAYKELEHETYLYFRKDCFNTDLTSKQISEIYKVPELFCRHIRNMYNRYYNIVGR